MTTLNYLQIQTPPDVWAELLKLNPIDTNETFYEPFRGEGSLFNQVDCSVKFWSEIEDERRCIRLTGLYFSNFFPIQKCRNCRKDACCQN